MNTNTNNMVTVTVELDNGLLHNNYYDNVIMVQIDNGYLSIVYNENGVLKTGNYEMKNIESFKLQ